MESSVCNRLVSKCVQVLPLSWKSKKSFERRYDTLSWHTVYNQYLQNGKRLVGEVAMEENTKTGSRQPTIFECSTVNVKI